MSVSDLGNNDTHEIAKFIVESLFRHATAEIFGLLETDFPEVDSDADTSLIKWPSVTDFTMQLGMKTIEEFVETWTPRNKEWMYCIDFIDKESRRVSDIYNYKVTWSIPTLQYPIPQATALVFFYIKVCRLSSPTSPVQVTYRFEADRTVHTPHQDIFPEKWLWDLITNKIQLFKTLDF